MTMRLSIISLAGIARTLVAVGMVRLDSMFWATLADGPLIATVWPSVAGGRTAETAAGSRGTC